MEKHPEFLIKTTEDGSHTLYVTELNEHYHSVHGAIKESELVYIDYGYKSCLSETVRIFEVGFGTGLNALLTALESIKDGKKVIYTSVEKYPLPAKITGVLNYGELTGSYGTDLFKKIHEARWDIPEVICENFILKKIRGDIINDSVDGDFDLVYFDAFGPEKQPEIWGRPVFEKIAGVTVRGGILVTYSAKGDVKRVLRECGFKVSVMPGPPGKRHVIRAIKS